MRVAVTQYEGSSTMRALPLAAGILAATAGATPDLADVDVAIHWRRHEPEHAARLLRGHDVVGVSLYTWNERYTIEVVRRLKAASPNTIVVAGGPSVPRRPADARRMLAETMLDALVAGEGERPFINILRACRGGHSLAAIAGVTTRLGDDIHMTARGPRLTTEDYIGLGSPYLDGTFDRLMAEAPGVHTSALFETNRGCPFSCTFCDWGQATESKVLELPLERVMAELRWAAERALPYLYFVDANFGIRKRDLSIVEGLGELARETGYPRFVYFHLTKNATEKNLATVEALTDAGIGTQVSLSMQDFAPEVLAAIKRDNIHPERALELRAKANARGIPTNNEIILGLPVQTPGSFRESIVQALTPFSGDVFYLHCARLLVNAELADPITIARYRLETRDVPSLPFEVDEPVHVEERERIVVGSDTMSVDAWRDAYVFGYLFASVVLQGLLATPLRLMRYALGLPLVPAVDALARADTPRLAALRETLARRADAILASESILAPIDGLGSKRREPLDAVCAEVLLDLPSFAREAEAVLRRFVPDDMHALLGEAIAWDLLHAPEHRARDEVHTFEHDWRDWQAADARTPARVRTRVERRVLPFVHAPRPLWFDSFIAIGWAKGPRVLLNLV